MTNPFMSVFTDTVDWNDPFGEEVGSYQLSADTVTISLEEYEHLLLRVATAERMYADSKDRVAWLEKFNAMYRESWLEALNMGLE